MKPLAPDEKTALVMVYTHNLLVRGEIVVKENVRVNIWLRAQGISNFIHFLKPTVILFGGAAPRSLNYFEFFVPTADVLAFHLAPPATEPLDYDASETNRMMKSVEMLVGSFVLNGKLRISTQTDLSTYLDVSHTAWTSVYDVEVGNPHLPQFSISVPMLLVNPSRVNFGIK